jgi:transcriptional regulator with XRE-family HTH domain
LKAKELRSLRLQYGPLTQKELASKLGLHVNTIKNYEKGRAIPEVVVIAITCVLKHGRPR